MPIDYLLPTVPTIGQNMDLIRWLKFEISLEIQDKNSYVMYL